MTGWRAFLIVWLGQLVSTFGSGLTSFALSVWILQRTGSITQFAVSALCATVPQIVLAPCAGALVDRCDRRIVMILSDAGSALCTLFVASLVAAGQLAAWHIYLAGAAASIAGAFQGPAYSASVTLLVPKEHYGRASGLRQLARSSSDLLAPAVAGVVMLAFGLEAIILLDFASFVVALVTLLVVRFPRTPISPERERTPAAPSLLREALDGWLYVVRRPGLFGLMCMYAAASLFGVTTEVLLRPYVLSTESSDMLGIVVSAMGLGFLVGGAIMSVWGGPRRRVYGIFGFEALVSVCTILLGFVLTPLALAAVVCLYFIGISLSDGSSQALWQAKVALDFQGRVFALRDMIAASAFPIGLLITAPLAEFVLGPALMPGGAWATSIGRVVGLGVRRGIALIFIVTGTFNLLVLSVAWLQAHIRNVERELPNAVA